MANQKTEVHDIPLKTTDVCLNEYNHDIKPYSGFRKNNSPFYGNVLSPWKTKSYGSIGHESYVDPIGEMFCFKEISSTESAFVMVTPEGNEIPLMPFGEEGTTGATEFLVRERIINTNSEYPNLLAMFEGRTGQWYTPNLYYCTSYNLALAQSPDGRVALLRDDTWEVVMSFTTSQLSIEPNEKIHTAQARGDICIVAVAGQVYVIDVVNRTIRGLYSSVDRTKNYLYGCCLLSDGGTGLPKEAFFVNKAWYDSSAGYWTNEVPYRVITHMSNLYPSGTNQIDTVTYLNIFSPFDTSFASLPIYNPGVQRRIAFVTNKGDVIPLERYPAGTTHYSPLGELKWHNSSSQNAWIMSAHVDYFTGDSLRNLHGVADGQTLVDIVPASTGDYRTADIVTDWLDRKADCYGAVYVYGLYCPRTGGHQHSSSSGLKGTMKVPVMRQLTDEERALQFALTFGMYSPQIWVIDHYEDVTVNDSYEQGSLPAAYCLTLVNASNGCHYNSAPVDANGKYRGGYAINYRRGLRILYNNGEMRGLSIANDDNNVGTLITMMDNIDSSKPVSVSDVPRYWWDEHSPSELNPMPSDYYYTNIPSPSYRVYFNDGDAWYSVMVSGKVKDARMSVFNDRYIVLNNVGYYNCFDVVNAEWSHFASDYNDRAVFCEKWAGNAGGTTFSAYKSNTNVYSVATVNGGAYEVLKRPFVSTIFPSYNGYCRSQALSSVVLPMSSTTDSVDVDIYGGLLSTYGNAPPYMYSMDTKAGEAVKYINEELSGTSYTFTFTYIPSVFAKYINGFVNQGIIQDGSNTYLQTFLQNHIPIFAIKAASQLEGMEHAFIIQGQYFVIMDGNIYEYSYSSGALKGIVSIASMEYIGSNPYMALFWSSTNSTFYKFTGDSVLTPVIQADEIKSILSSSYNPNTQSIYITTEDFVIVLSEDHMSKIPLQNCYKAMPSLFGCVVVNDNETRLLSYRDFGNVEMETVPIELETESYGLGNSIKSVNDCVYIRLFDKEKKEGKVKLSCETLNEISKETDIKEFNITKDMWDKNSSTIFIRYQPKYQAATGFSVRIESPFAIASLQISATPETLQNSKYNV